MNDDGRREVLGLDVVTAETTPAGSHFPAARGLKEVELAISEAQPGLKDAIASLLRGGPGNAAKSDSIAKSAGAPTFVGIFPNRESIVRQWTPRLVHHLDGGDPRCAGRAET